MKILITDPLLRKTFDIVNILKINYTIEDFIFVNDISLLKIRYLYKSNNVFLLRQNSFIKDLNYIANQFIEESIVYIPIEEITTISFYKYLNNFKNNNFKYFLPPFSIFELSRNKDVLNVFCEKNNISCPKYYSEEQIKKGAFKAPIILKPKIGSGSNGIRFIHNKNKLNVNEVNFKNYFIQELLDNPKEIEAGFFLCKKGEVISYYSHRRIRTYPEKGGVSVFSQLKLNKEIKKTGAQIIKKLNWTGLIMIEFLKCKETEDYKLIEINPRIWGSIMLSEFSNANFLSSYINLCLEKPIDSMYEIEDKYIRWIFPYDLIHFLKNPQNPFTFFKINKDTCYINFTYTNLLNSLKFIFLTYFSLKKIFIRIKNG